MALANSIALQKAGVIAETEDIEGVEEVRRKFFGTLYNTYSFFALYANIDEFNYQEDEGI